MTGFDVVGESAWPHRSRDNAWLASIEPMYTVTHSVQISLHAVAPDRFDLHVSDPVFDRHRVHGLRLSRAEVESFVASLTAMLAAWPPPSPSPSPPRRGPA